QSLTINNVNFTLAASQTWTIYPTSGVFTPSNTLSINGGTINLNGNNLTLGLSSNAQDTITIAAPISGSGTVIYQGGAGGSNGITIGGGTSTYTGTTTLNQIGNLVIIGDTPFGASSVQDAGSIVFSNSTLSNDFTITSSSSAFYYNTPAATLTLNGTVTYSTSGSNLF
ncbi:MAG TPA: hypothetical protein PLV25_04290, partial [Opitutales bacterium]|nr:hypothetical protein [Opitutales bacterium]